MKCLSKYKWVKVPRDEIPDDTGILIYYLRLASRVAFRKGFSQYCGHKNAVEAGSWAGGIVGLKSILKAKSRRETLEIMDELTFTDMDGEKILYEVQVIDVLQPDAVDTVRNSDFDLVLYTCTYGGESRVVVFCNRVKL